MKPDSSGSMSRTVYSSTSIYTPSTWPTEQTIIEAPVPALLPRSLVVGRLDDPDVTQLYYLDSTKMKEAQFTNNRWSSGDHGSSIPESSMENGSLGALGWDSTAMRWYMSMGNGRCEQWFQILIEEDYELEALQISEGSISPYPMGSKNESSSVIKECIV